MQEAQDQVTSTMRSSNGRTLTLVIEQDAAKKSIQGGKVGLKRVRAHDGREWKVFTAADLKWQPPGDCVTAQADKPRGDAGEYRIPLAATEKFGRRVRLYFQMPSHETTKSVAQQLACVTLSR